MRVTTSSKFKRILDLQIGDRVLPHQGHYRPVTHLFQRAYDGELLRIKVKLIGTTLEVTPGASDFYIKGLGKRENFRSETKWLSVSQILEGLCPPYVTDMDEAVDRVLEEKFGSGGTYADPDVFGKAYRDRASAAGYLEKAAHHLPWSSTRRRSAATWSRRTGASPRTRTPCTCPASRWSLGPRAQYYVRFGDPGHARRQAEGREIWGR